MSMLRKLETACRAAFAWKPVTGESVGELVHVERNSVTGRSRWCHKTMPRAIPDSWKEGLPPRSVTHPPRPAPPSGGSSGVKPAPSWRDQGALREALQNVERDIALAEKEKPARRLSITPAPAGGFIVGEQEHRHSMPFFANRYAGNLADCLNFIEAELTEEAA